LDEVPVEGSPWWFNAERVSVREWRAFGAGLTHGVATAPCQFTVHSPYDKMPGTCDRPYDARRLNHESLLAVNSPLTRIEVRPTALTRPHALDSAVADGLGLATPHASPR